MKRKRPGATYVKVELAGVSRHGAREIHEVIERVLKEERSSALGGRSDASERVQAEMGEGSEAAQSKTALRDMFTSARAAHSSPPVTLIFEPDFVVDCVGAQSIPRDLDNPHTWEAWRVPTYDLASGVSAEVTGRDESGSSSTARASRPGPSSRTRGRPQGRFHTHYTASKRQYVPGNLSVELRSALGMSSDGDGDSDQGSDPPWFDRMLRYGAPPAFVIESLRGRLDEKVLKMFDEEEDGEKSKGLTADLTPASESDCVRKLLEFPLYLRPGRSLSHPVFAALQRREAHSNSSKGEAGGGLLRVAPCPVT
eukprot:g991.t1